MNKPVTTMMLAILVLAVGDAQAQPSRTGTNLNAKAMPSEVLVLKEPDEVERIRRLMLDGRKEAALEAAGQYITEVERNSLRHETLPKYYAWNAYCTVLTSLHRIDEAIAACSTAMAYEPGKWSAVNNRGTAKFVGGRLQEALADYNAALAMAEGANPAVRDTIQYNISLVQQRQ